MTNKFLFLNNTRNLRSTIFSIGVLLALSASWAKAQQPAQITRKPFGDALSREHPPRARTYHLQHVLLKVALDERRKSVSGTSTLTLRPLAAGLQSVEVDSADLQIQSVTLPNGNSLTFEQAGEKLNVRLPEAASPNDLITIAIAFSGTPKKGLYFVMPDKANPDKPVQIWSQGEAEDSHYWFPVYDYPNDRATSEGYYTVNADYTVISNGRLAGVEENSAAHTKTYHWIEDIPHSTYLISVVAGKFEKYTVQLGQTPVEYYVPPGTGRDKALRSFRETPEAIRFFAEKIGIPYPYNKYSQVAVHDFVFGGMENISATTLTDRTLHEELSEPEVNSLDLVTHELAHQWFGDLLTCAGWADIWLNEGFATFWEDLYREHRFGEQDYRYSLQVQENRYLEEDRRRYRRPMVTSFYTDPLDLFDRSAYEKGALVLDMLRFVLGDERFFAAISHYARTHVRQNVITEDLEKSVEESSGEDLKWFFDEWAYKTGYPELEITEDWDESSKMARLTVQQKQTVDGNTPLFRMPVEIDFTTQNGITRRRVEFSRASEEFSFQLDSKPVMTRFDPEHRVLETVKFRKPIPELLYQLKNDSSVPGRIWASEQLALPENNPGGSSEIVKALRESLAEDSFWGVRQTAANELSQIKTDASRDALAEGLRDKDPRVRHAAVRALGSFANDGKAAELVEGAYDKDQNVIVAAAAAFAIGKIHAKGARQVLEKAVERTSDRDVIRQNALRGLGELGEKKDWDVVAHWLADEWPTETRIAAVDALVRLSKDQADKTAARLIALLEDSNMFVKQRAINALGEGNFQQAREALMKTAENETDSRLRRSARLALERLAGASSTQPSKGKAQIQSAVPQLVTLSH